jgi:hypothetical protein
MSWGAFGAILQTLPVPLVFVIVLLQPDAFNQLLERTPYGSVLAALGLCLLVVTLLWRLFVELTYTIPAMRREHAEAALGRRVLSIARRQRRLPASRAEKAAPRAPGPAGVLIVSDDLSELLDEEAVERPDDELALFATLKGPLFAISDAQLLAYRSRFSTLHPHRGAPIDLAC